MTKTTEDAQHELRQSAQMDNHWFGSSCRSCTVAHVSDKVGQSRPCLRCKLISCQETVANGMRPILWALQSVKFRFAHERDLQESIAEVLEKRSIPYVREHWLSSTDKIDFLCGHVGIEVKVDGSANALSRQVLRYLRHTELTSLIVVTSKVSHVLPAVLDGKSIRTLVVGGL